jgi:hypothetical protein
VQYLKVPKDDFSLQEEHFSLEVEPLVEVGLDHLLEVVLGHAFEVFLRAAPLGDGLDALFGLPLLGVDLMNKFRS